MKTKLQSSVLTALNLAAALFALATLPAAAVNTALWGGGGADANWQTGANWSGGSGASGAAASTDILSFSGGTRTTPNNNFTALTSFGGITFVNDGTSGKTAAFTLTGNSITLAGVITTTAASPAIADTISLDIAFSGARSFNIGSGHTLTVNGKISGSGAISKVTGADTLTLGNTANSFTGGFKINIGTVNAAGAGAMGSGGITLGNGSNNGKLNFTDGGILSQQVTLGDATATAGNTGCGSISNNAANGSGALTFSATTFNPAQSAVTAPRTLTLGGANTDANVIQGVIQDNATSPGTIALTKTEAGTWFLSGVNTYSGATAVNGGKLIGVTGGSCANSDITVANTAGCVLGVNVVSSGGQWTCKSLTLSGANAGLEFGFGVAPSTATAPLTISGTLTISAGTPTIALDAANLTAGTGYVLLTCGGTAPTSWTPTPTIVGAKGTLAAGAAYWVGNTLKVDITGTTAEPLTWNTSGTGTWDINTTTAWKDSTGAASKTYQQSAVGDQVQFTDTGLSANTTVTLNNVVNPANITFNNSTYNYTLSGTGGIVGPATVTKTGTGTVTINTPLNSYSGGTVVKNGTFNAATGAKPNAFGSGTITLGDASGGPATVLGGWQSYANPINLGANAVGPLSLGDNGDNLGNSGSFKGAINLNGNNLNLTRPALALTANYQFQNAFSGTGSLTISNASTGGTGGTISFASGGPISISGNITNASSGTSGATTTISVSVGSGVTNIVQNSASLPLTVSGALTVNPATTLVNASGAGALFTLSGGATGTGGLTLNNNSSTADAITISTNAVNPTGGVTNSGSGSGEVLISSVLGANVTAVVQNSANSNLKLQGVNTYTGDTIVSAGKLILDTTCTMANTTNFVVGSGGTLDVSTEATALALGNTQKLKVSATGTSSTATINMAASKGLTLNATAGKGVEFTAYNGGATAPLTLSGSGGSLALNSAPVTLSSASGLAAGPYTLISHGGSATVTGSPGTFSPGVGALATGATGALSVNGSGDLILTLSYTVTLTNNDASGTTSTISVANGSTYGTLPTPTRTGYTFNGWFTASSGGTQVTSGTTVSLTAPQTLYAQWTLSAVPPTKLVITAVPSGTTPAGNTFSVTVTAADSGNTAQAVTSDTGILLAASGSGTLGGNTATILNGQSSVTLTGVTYTKAEAITLTASQTSGTPSLSTSVASSSFSIVPNVASAANSTVVASPASLAADNSSLSTVTATLQDAYGNLLVGSNVTWSATGTGNTLTPASSGTANGSGVASFTIKSTKAETKTVTVTVGATVVTNLLQITFNTPSTGNSFTWDPSHNGSGSDAAGTWDTSTTNWANGAADFAWPNNLNDKAIFGTGGALSANYAIAMGAPVTVSNLTFNTTGANQYVLSADNPITLAGTVVSVAGAAKINSQLVGDGSLTKIGSGTLTLGPTNNTFTGGINIKNGTFIAGNDPNNLGTGSVTLGVAASDPAAGPATLSFNWNTYTNPITLGASAVAPLTLTDIGSANPQVTGGINLNGNNLNILKSGGTLASRNLNIATTAITGSGNLTCSNVNVAGPGTINISAPVNITGSITNVGGGTNATAISGNIGSTVTAVVQNSATAGLTLSGSNTFSGGLYVNAGTVQTGATAATATNAFGSGNIYLGDTSGNANATLIDAYSSATAGITNPIVVQAGNAGTSLLQCPAGNSMFCSGLITLNNTLTLDGGNGTGGTQMIFAGGFTGAGNLVVNCSSPSGIVQFKTGASANFSGTVKVVSGTLNNNGGNMLTVSNVVQVFAGATNWIASSTIAGLNDNAGAGGVLLNGFTGTRTLTLGGSGSYSFNGTIQNNATNQIIAGAPSVAVTVTNGAHTFGGANTYSGATTISGGTLALGTGGSIASTTNIWVGSGATFDVSAVGMSLGSSQTLKISATGGNASATNIVASGKNLTLGNATTGLEFTQYGGGSTAPLTLTGTGGNLNLNSKPIKVDTTSALAQGPYTLIAHGGSATVSGTPVNLDLSGGLGLASGATGLLSLNGAGDLILTLSYTVSFNSNGGSSVATQNVAYNGTATQPSPNPTKSGYSFGGWYSDAGLTTYFNFSTAITGPTTLYAKWNNASTGFNQTAAGPWDYNTATNWVNNTINGTWNSDLSLAAAQTVTFAGSPSANPTLTFNYAGNYALTLMASAAGTQSLTLGGDINLNTSGGTSANVTLGDSANHLNVDLGGATRTVTVAANRTLRFSDVVSDGSITMTGAGTLTLSGQNTFAGGLTIKSGTVKTVNTGNSNLGGGGYGAVTLGDSAGGPASLLLSWQVYSNAITLGTSAVGPLTIGDCMEYTTGGQPFVAGGINLNGNNLNFYNAPGRNGNMGLGYFTANTGGAITGTGSLTLSNMNTTAGGVMSVTAPVNFTGAITNTGAGTTIDTISGNIASTVTAVVQNSATAGLTLSGSNTFSGGVFINAGTVTASTSTNALGGAAGNGMVYLGDTSGSANATLLFNYVLNGFANPITVQSGSSGNTLTISATGFTPLAGAITQNNSFTAYPVGAQTILFNGQITGSSQITVTNDTGTGAVIFNADNHSTWTGPLVVQNGTFRTQGANALGANNTVQLYPGTTFDTYYANPTIAGLNDNGSGAGGLVTNVFAGYATTLTLGGSGTYSFAGIIGGGSLASYPTNQMALTKSGSGTQTLGGINTYSGTTTISAGTLALGASGSIGNSAAIVVASNAIFNVSGLSSAFTLAQSLSSQTLSNSTPGAIINGTSDCSAGTISLVYNGVNPSFIITNGGMTLSASTSFKVNNTGAALGAGSYKVIAKATAGNVGLVAGTVPSAVKVGGASTKAPASLQIINGELYLNVGVTTLALVSSSPTNGYQSSVTFTATVLTNGITASLASGTVQFKTNGAAFGSPVGLTSGIVSTNLSTLPRGTNTIVAEYSGDANYLPSTNSLLQVVTNHPPVAVADSLAWGKGTASKDISIASLLANDTDADSDTITLVSVDAASANGVVLTTNATYVQYTGALTNNDSFSYTISDGHGGTATALVSITATNSASAASGSIEVVGGQASTVFFGITGDQYEVQRSTNLVDWKSISTNTAPDSGAITNLDTFSDLTPPYPGAAYYRLITH